MTDMAYTTFDAPSGVLARCVSHNLRHGNPQAPGCCRAPHWVLPARAGGGGDDAGRPATSSRAHSGSGGHCCGNRCTS